MIINPHAGSAKGVEVADEATPRLTAAGIEIERLVSEEPGGTRRIAEQIDPKAWDGVLVVGGDGSLFEVVNGLFATDPELPVPVGQIPVGTGNSFLRDVGVETVDAAIECIIGQRTRLVDLGRFTYDAGSFVFANLLGAGFVSNVAHRAIRFKRFGQLAYVIGVLAEIIARPTSAVTIAIDDEVIERDALFVEICNSRFTGGSMMMAPGAQIDDGLLDVIVVRRISRRTVLKLLPKIYTGTHVDHPAVEVFRGSRVTLTSETPLALTPDGETFGSTPIDVSTLHHRLEVFGL